MNQRQSVGLADLDALARRILDGSFANRPGCVLEISNLAWSQNPLEAQQRFEDACEQKGDRVSGGPAARGRGLGLPTR